MNSIVDEAAEFAANILQNELPPGSTYHNFTHTLEVVEAAKDIGKNSDLTGDELEQVLIAAWFHDTGISRSYESHEIKSYEIAKEFLKQKRYPDHKIEKVSQIILSTKIPQTPSDKLEAVLCDADLLHIGKKGLKNKSDLLRTEWETILKKSFTDEGWIKDNLEFLANNKFHTKYAKDNFEERRLANIAKLKKRLSKINNGSGTEMKEHSVIPKDEPVDEVKKKKRGKETDRGIETMFRNTIRTHVEFSSLADSKANIMISVNTLLLTAIIAILARKLDSNPHLIIPTIIITSVSLSTLIFAVLVTRPKITSGTFTVEDIKEKRANLLFFGNFFNMDLKNFEWGMNEMMNDREFLYGSMIKDLYYLGQVLGKKYRYLRVCYNIFMYGLIISIIAFGIAVISYPGVTEIGPLLE